MDRDLIYAQCDIAAITRALIVIVSIQRGDVNIGANEQSLNDAMDILYEETDKLVKEGYSKSEIKSIIRQLCT